MDTNMITYLACICFLFIFGRIFILPLKKIGKIILNSILGGICIYVINLIGSAFGFHIGLNFFTSILIRIIGITRCGLLNCCKIINRIKSPKIQYDAIILDQSFPEKEGKKATGREGEKLLEIMEKKNCNLPVLIHSIMLKKPDYSFVFDFMCSWELLKLQKFLDYVVEK